MLAIFYDHPVKTGEGEDGLPFYENKTYVKIHRSAAHVMDRLAKEEDYQRFPQEYAHYQRAREDREQYEGFPLDMWARLTPADVSNLKARGVYTVQQLAKAKTDGWPGDMKQIVGLAKEFVKIAGQGNRDTTALEKALQENEVLKEDLQSAKSQVARLRKELKEANEAAV